MSLSDNDILKIAHLARLTIAPEAIASYRDKLSNIMGFIEHMQQVDTSATDPLASTLEITQRLRADIVTEENLRDKYQQNAQKKAAGLYLVPKVIEEA